MCTDTAKLIIPSKDSHLDREPGGGGVNLAEKVTNFDMVSNDLHI